MIGWVGFQVSAAIAHKLGAPDRWTLCALVGLGASTSYVLVPIEKLLDLTVGRYLGHEHHCHRALVNAIARGSRDDFRNM